MIKGPWVHTPPGTELAYLSFYFYMWNTSDLSPKKMLRSDGWIEPGLWQEINQICFTASTISFSN